MSTTKKVSTKKVASKSKSEFPFECYSVQSKQVEPIAEGTATITKTSRGAYMIKGESKEGLKLAGIISSEKAQAWIAAGLAEDQTKVEEAPKKTVKKK